MNSDQFDGEIWLLNHTIYTEEEIRQLDTEMLVHLLKHPDWEQRQEAALELQARNDARAFEVLINVFEIDEEVKVKTALARLQELRIKVEVTREYYKLLVPHNLDAAGFIEFGYVMAQLADIPFPEDYAPISTRGSQTFHPRNKEPNVEYRESYSSYMKFFVYRRKKRSKTV